MSLLEAVGSVAGTLVATTLLGGLFLRYGLLPYLRDHLIAPVLQRLDAMHDKDAELEVSYRLAGLMFDGHMAASEEDRRHIWEAVTELRKDRHVHV